MMERIVTREELRNQLDGMLERAKRRTLIAPTSVVAFEMRKENLLGEFDATGNAYFCGVTYRRAD
jgi:hypothetical protein